jgi:hypothetical protein
VYWPGFKASQVCCCFATLSVTGRGLLSSCLLISAAEALPQRGIARTSSWLTSNNGFARQDR